MLEQRGRMMKAMAMVAALAPAALAQKAPAIPEGCTSYNDGCNTCTVANGALGACTTNSGSHGCCLARALESASGSTRTCPARARWRRRFALTWCAPAATAG